MKKRLLIIVILIATLCLTGCNYEPIEFHYDYDKIICNYEGDKFELRISSWTDYDGEQVQIRSEGKTYLLSMNKCYMVREI
jgi:hypothetical protein